MTDLEVSHRLALGVLRVTRAFASEEGKGLSQVSEAIEVLLKLSGIYLHWRRWEGGEVGGGEVGGGEEGQWEEGREERREKEGRRGEGGRWRGVIREERDYDSVCVCVCVCVHTFMLS